MLDRYILGQLILTTLFMTSILIGAIWLAQSLRFVDILINGGMGFWTFIKMVHFLLPDFLGIILPLAAVISTMIVYSKLSQDRELLVMRAMGMSYWALARPGVLWSLFLTILLYGINLYLMPVAFRHFKDLEFNFRKNAVVFALQEGEFNSIQRLTAYVRSRYRTGDLQGILLYDQRNKEKPTLLIAEQGSLFQQGGETYLKMKKGSHQEQDSSTGKVSILCFDEFLLNLSSVMGSGPSPEREKKLHEKFLAELWKPTKEESKLPFYKAKMQAEAHGRLVRPLYCLCFVILFLSVFLRAEFHRQSRYRRLWGVMGAIVLLYGLGMWFMQLMVRYPSLAALFYLLVFIPIGGGLILLWGPFQRRMKSIVVTKDQAHD